jgi:WASH complex subunit strumpellin
VRSDPRAVLKLRCVFLKLRSGLELPLLRAAQAGDAAVAPLQRYYSSALLAYVRKVLEVSGPWFAQLGSLMKHGS